MRRLGLSASLVSAETGVGVVGLEEPPSRENTLLDLVGEGAAGRGAAGVFDKGVDVTRGLRTGAGVGVGDVAAFLSRPSLLNTEAGEAGEGADRGEATGDATRTG